MHNEQLVAQIKASIEQTIQNEIEKIPSPIEYSKVNGFIMAHHQNAMQEVRITLSLKLHKTNLILLITIFR